MQEYSEAGAVQVANGHGDDVIPDAEPSRIYHDRTDIPPAPKQARSHTVRRERWVNLPKTPEYQDWQIFMWTNFPSHYLNTLADLTDEARKARLNEIFRAHNGWRDENQNEYPQPSANVADGDMDFWDAIPQEVANTLIAMMNAEQKQLSFLVPERPGTSQRR